MTKEWFLESGSISDIFKSKARFDALVEFHWQYYSELAFQRTQIREQLKNSLRGKAAPFEFQNWQRIVRYKHSLNPLSTRGSVTDPGGRFNVGQIDPARYPVFPALYIASDKGTALAEVLGREQNTGSLTPEELALTKPDSITAVSVSGKLESVLEIRERGNLLPFVNLIKGFKVSKSLVLKARKLRFLLDLVKTPKVLGDVLEQRNWREWPMLYDVPSTCQVFGGIVMNAGIEGILYNSAITQRECLAIFPQNFLNSSSFLELDDEPPSAEVQRRVDSTNFDSIL